MGIRDVVSESNLQRSITLDFLRTISNHLSARKDCKQCSYEVVIGNTYVMFVPYKTVFPSIHKRKVTDKQSIINHVIMNHYKDSLSVEDNMYDENTPEGFTRIKPNILAKGRYTYRLSIDGKRRKWFKEL